MSSVQNETRLEGFRQHFEEALETLNYRAAMGVAQDCIDEGYTTQGNKMKDEVIAAQDKETKDELV